MASVLFIKKTDAGYFSSDLKSGSNLANHAYGPANNRFSDYNWQCKAVLLPKYEQERVIQ